MLDQKTSIEFKGGNCLLAGHGWEMVEKPFQTVASREVVEEILDGYASPCEDGRAVHDIGVNPDDRFECGHRFDPASGAMVAEFRHSGTIHAAHGICLP